MAHVTLTGPAGTNGASRTIEIGPVTDPKAIEVFLSIRDHFSAKGGIVLSTGEATAMWVPSSWTATMELDRPLDTQRGDLFHLHGTVR